MPPLEQAQSPKKERRAVPGIEALLNEKIPSLTAKLRGVSQQEATVSINRQVSRWYENQFSPEEIIDNICRACPDGLDRIEFESWLGRYIDNNSYPNQKKFHEDDQTLESDIPSVESGNPSLSF